MKTNDHAGPETRTPEISAPPARHSPWWQSTLAMMEPLSIAALFLFLLEQSWLRWMDPLIDFPRSLYVAWRLSEGDLLYDRVMSWYGPLPHLVEAAGFRIFGVGIDTVAWINVAVTALVVWLIRAIFGELGNRWSGWLCTVVFICVFAFAHYGIVANYNFMGPYAAQATYGFAGVLLVVWGLLRHLRSARKAWFGVLGLGLAVAFLDKPEPLLAAVGVITIYLTASFLRQARFRPPATEWRIACKWLAQSGGWLAGGFLCLWIPI